MLTALAALAVLVLGPGGASANSGAELSVASGELGRVRADSAALTFSGGGFEIICAVSRTLTLNRTIAKVVGASVGSVYDVRLGACRGGEVRVLAPETRRPWPITYVSFAGTLPNISSIRLELRGTGFLVRAFFGAAQCLFGGEPRTGEAQGTTVGGTTVTSIRADQTIGLRRVVRLGGIACPTEGFFGGSLTVTPNVRIRLI